MANPSGGGCSRYSAILPQPFSPDVAETCENYAIFDIFPNMTVTPYLAAGSNGPDEKKKKLLMGFMWNLDMGPSWSLKRPRHWLGRLKTPC